MPRIRTIALADAPALADLQQSNRAFLAPWEPLRSDEHYTAAGQSAVITGLLEAQASGQCAAFVILDDEGRVAGQITLSGIVRGALQSCAVGYWLAEPATGHGFATQALEEAVQHAFDELDLHRVQAEALPANIASLRVLAHCGFTVYGLAPQYLRIAGQWQDCLMLQRLAD